MPSVLHCFACSKWFYKDPFQKEAREVLAVALDYVSQFCYPRDMLI